MAWRGRSLHDGLASALPDYDIGDEVGDGGGGVVFSGRHRVLRRDVAVKLLLQAYRDDAEMRRRFRVEAVLLARLDHPHIVRVEHFVEHDGLCLLVMELLTGGTLTERMDDLPPQAACALLLAACAGLQHAHERGILHRDVKPDNLMFSGGDLLKVTDFGIAKVLQGSKSMMTDGGYVVGTPAYMALEQADGGELTPAADTYAAGTVLYELLARQLPFPQQASGREWIERKRRDDPIPLWEVAPHVPEPIARVVMRAIEREPSDRYPSAHALGSALAEAAWWSWGRDWHLSSGVTLCALPFPTTFRRRDRFSVPTVVRDARPGEPSQQPPDRAGAEPGPAPDGAPPRTRRVRPESMAAAALGVLALGVAALGLAIRGSALPDGLRVAGTEVHSGAATPLDVGSRIGVDLPDLSTGTATQASLRFLVGGVRLFPASPAQHLSGGAGGYSASFELPPLTHRLLPGTVTAELRLEDEEGNAVRRFRFPVRPRRPLGLRVVLALSAALSLASASLARPVERRARPSGGGAGRAGVALWRAGRWAVAAVAVWFLLPVEPTPVVVVVCLALAAAACTTLAVVRRPRS